MNYNRARNVAWEILIRNNVRALPVNLYEICQNEHITLLTYTSGRNFIESMSLETHIVDNDAFSIGRMIFYDDTKPEKRQRFSVAHELGHIFLHTTVDATVFNRETEFTDDPIETEANVFAARLLAPLCVLQFLNVNSPEEISKLCDISISSAVIRFKRLCQIRKRNKIRKNEKNHGTFLLAEKERQVYENFKEFIAENKSKSVCPVVSEEEK